MRPKTHLLLRTVIAALIAAVLFSGIYLLAYEWFNSWSLFLSEEFGYLGVGIFVFLVDLFIVPTSPDVMFPLVMTWNPVVLLLVMSAASSAGGFCGYLLARRLGSLNSLDHLLLHVRRRGEPFVRHYGAWAVVLAAVTPIPFSTVCWAAGLLKVPVMQVAPAVLARLPRMVIYYLLIRIGVLLLS